ncbi:MAG: hypothetical protein IJZ77_03155, partial [Bacilli bacterium]|nr:hypothetical protein [Bacilli bacterium]
ITSKAKGHNYISKFVWADDYSSATIVFTCLNDKEHVIEENAEITIVVTPATCTSNEITTYTATVVFEGVEYTNVKETLGEKLDHTYLDKWLFNDNMHWKECSCGDKDNMNSHTFDDGIVVIEPTCKENGEIKYTCECGYEKFEDLAPTYEHTYVDGVCTGCGKTEDSCDHNEFTNVEVNMSDYGACDGVFTYKVCSCGEVCLVEEEAFYNLKCNMNDMNTDYCVDYTVNMYIIASGKCPDCGLYVEMKS